MPTTVVVYTKTLCRSCTLAKELLESKGVPFTEIDVSDDLDQLEEMLRITGGSWTAPQVIVDGTPIGGYDAMLALEELGKLDPILFPGGSSEESNRPKKTQSTEKSMGEQSDVREVLIIGSGCAGLTSAIYAARANLKPIVIEGREAGGQLSITTDVENFPGFPEGIMGPDLVQNMKKQAERFGTEYQRGDVSRVDLSERPFKVWIEDEESPILTKTIIIATGATARMLGLEGEMPLIGHGLSTCATCDGFFFRDKEIAIVGGGDSALEEATFLTRFASKVTVIHRRDTLRGSKIMQQRAFDNDKIEFLWDTVPVGYLSEGGTFKGLKVKNVKTEEVSDFRLDGCFLAIGHTPNTSFLGDAVELDPKGYLLVHRHTHTSVNGVFGAGDVHDQHFRQAITASAMGCMAAIDAEKWLEAGGINDEDWLSGR